MSTTERERKAEVSNKRQDGDLFIVDNSDAAVAYVESNPVKTGLCRRIDDWPYGSARLRKL
ncbi:MAG: hypothetical protein ACR2LZ_12565 [Pyrinomonadaceae bacterium]